MIAKEYEGEEEENKTQTTGEETPPPKPKGKQSLLRKRQSPGNPEDA